MSDTGNTASQVSPSIPTEQEMTTIRSMFERAANAIVQASELSVKLTDLEGRFNQLQADMESQRRRNQELDEFLAHTRRQRDEAEHNLSQVQRKLDDTEHALKTEQGIVSSMGQEIASLKAKLSETEENHRKAQADAIDNFNRAEQAESKLSDIQSHMQDVFGLMKPQPQPEPTPQASPEPAPVQTRKVFEGEAGFDWQRQPQPEWDDQARRWTQEVAA